MNPLPSKYHTCECLFFFYKGEVERGEKNKAGRKEGVGSERDINSAGHYPLER